MWSGSEICVAGNGLDGGEACCGARQRVRAAAAGGRHGIRLFTANVRTQRAAQAGEAGKVKRQGTREARKEAGLGVKEEGGG